MMDFKAIGEMAKVAEQLPIELRQGFAQLIAQQETMIELLRKIHTETLHVHAVLLEHKAMQR